MTPEEDKNAAPEAVEHISTTTIEDAGEFAGSGDGNQTEGSNVEPRVPPQETAEEAIARIKAEREAEKIQKAADKAARKAAAKAQIPQGQTPPPATSSNDLQVTVNDTPPPKPVLVSEKVRQEMEAGKQSISGVTPEVTSGIVTDQTKLEMAAGRKSIETANR